MTINELLVLLNELDTMDVSYSADICKGQTVSRIWISELRTTSPHYHNVLSALTRAFGRLDKTISSGVQSWSGKKDGTSLTMYRVAQCKVTGYKTVERKKTIEVETEEIEVDEVPIYDCTEAE